MPTLVKIEGFTEAADEVKHRLIIASEGPERRGKTHFAFTMPGPLAILPFDTGTLEGLVHKFRQKKQILVPKEDLSFEPGGGSKAEYEKIWKRVEVAYDKCLNTKGLRSMLIDTGSQIWELLRLARFGKLTQVMPHHYGPVNEEFRGFIRRAYDANINLTITHKVKKQYVGAKDKESWNGKYERSGNGDIGFLSQVQLLHGRDMEEPDKPFWIKVLDCRQNADMAGETLSGDMCDFPTLGSMVFPESDPEEWV